MRNVLKNEMYKAFCNKWFVGSVILATCLTLASAFEMILYELGGNNSMFLEGSNPMIEVYGILNHWIGGEGMTVASPLFYFLLPIFTTVPYSWSYHYENKRGYASILMAKAGKWEYLFSKYFAVFLSGGLTILIPLAINIAVVALFLPAVNPDVSYNAYYGIVTGGMLAETFYLNPVLFVCIYLLLNFIFSGLLAGLGLTISFWIHNRLAITLIPFIILLLVHVSMIFFSGAILNGAFIPEYSPIAFLKPRITRSSPSLAIVLGETAGLAFFSLTALLCVGRRKNVM